MQKVMLKDPRPDRSLCLWQLTGIRVSNDRFAPQAAILTNPAMPPADIRFLV